MMILAILCALVGFAMLVLAVMTGEILWLMILGVAVFVGILALVADTKAKKAKRTKRNVN